MGKPKQKPRELVVEGSQVANSQNNPSPDEDEHKGNYG